MSSSGLKAALRRFGFETLPAVLLVSQVASAAQAAPRAVLVEPRQQSVGEVEPDKVLRYDYTLRNGGDAPLVIQGLEPTCYCTTAKADASEVPPGGQTALHITIDPSDFVGDITKGVELSTNDPQDPKQLIEIALRVRPGIAVVPPEIDFGNVGPEGTKPHNVDMKTARERPFHVQQVTSEAKYLSIEQEPIDLDYRVGVKLMVKVLPGAVPPGPFATRVVVQTDDATKPRIEIPVRGVGPGGLQVQPGKLVFDKAAPGAEVGSLEVSGGKVTSVRTSSPNLVAALEPLDGGHYRVRVKLAGTAKPGRLLGKLFVKTADAAQPEIIVPVLGLVR